MKQFCNSLVNRGLTPVEGSDSTRLYGDFTGRNATVEVVATENGINVYEVIVSLEPSTEWDSLVETYDYYKNLYSLKYGEPTVLQDSDVSYHVSNDSRMYDLENGIVEYESIWKLESGGIALSIEKSSSRLHLSGEVMISYRDYQNVEAKIQNDLDEI